MNSDVEAKAETDISLTLTNSMERHWSPHFFATRRFIDVFTKNCHWSVSRARLIQSTISKAVSLTASHLLLGTLSGFFFPATILYASFIPHARYMPCPSDPPGFDRSSHMLRRVQSSDLLGVHVSSSSVTSALSGPQHLFSNTHFLVPLCPQQWLISFQKLNFCEPVCNSKQRL